MHIHRHTAFGARCTFLALAIFAVVGCSERAPERPVGAAPPPEAPTAVDDPRIGGGLPAEVRLAGTEHNRLTIAVLRANRGRQHRFSDPGERCAAILDVLDREATRSATAAGTPNAAPQLRALLRFALDQDRACASVVAAPSRAALVGDARVTAETNPDSVLSDAAFQVLDRLQTRIVASGSESEVSAALDEATRSAAALGPMDATAVQAAVSQTQGSVVLWSPGGAGWTELEPALEPQSLFRKPVVQEFGLMAGFLGAVAADFGGCRTALQAIRSLGIAMDPRLMVAACGFAAAGATVAYGYGLYHQE